MSGSLPSLQENEARASSHILWIKRNSTRFWGHCPALFLGFTVLLATAFAFHPHPLLIAFLLLLGGSKGSFRSFLLCVCLALAMYTYTLFRLPAKTLPQEKIQGVALFHIDSVKEGVSFFNRSLIYKGTIRHFESTQGSWDNLPCYIYLSPKQARPLAYCDYQIEGTLCCKGDFRFVLKPDKAKGWTPIASSFNLAEYRFLAKQRLLNYFKKQIPDTRTRTLLFALIAGEIDEKLLSLTFSKVGLQHLLTVSGFHFTLITFCLGLLLHALFPYRLSCCLLLLILSAYALFVGNACAIQRAYIASSLVILGRLFCLRISGLNALGIGLMIELLVNPLHLLDLGFQFSFLCTFALLLLYPLIDTYLPRQERFAVTQKSLPQQHAYLIVRGLRSTFALTLAVHLVSIPLSLCLFHKFPLFSLFYNLLFPACIALSLFLLVISLMITPLIPWAAKILLCVCAKWTTILLHLTSDPPMGLHFCLRSSSLSFPLLLCCLGILIGIAIPLFEKKVVLEKKQIL